MRFWFRNRIYYTKSLKLWSDAFGKSVMTEEKFNSAGLNILLKLALKCELTIAVAQIWA